MIRRGTLVLLLVAAGTRALASVEVSPQDFAYGMQVLVTGEAAAYRLALPLTVYQKTVRSDLGDLRVFNARGEVVPYALERASTETAVHQPTRPLPVFALRDESAAALDAVRVTIESGTAALNLQTARAGETPHPVTNYIIDGRALDAPLAAFLLEWSLDAADFAGRLKVEAGGSLGDWRTVVEAAPVANLRSGGERLVENRVELAAAQAKFWRLSWAGAAAPFVVTSVSAEPARGHVDVRRSNLIVPGRAVAGKRGEYEFDLAARLPIDRVNIELPEPNTIAQIELLSRAAPGDEWRTVVHCGFYRLKSEGRELRNGTVPIALESQRYWLARVNPRGGGLGSGVPRLSVGWIPHDVMFLARGAGPFMLAYGSATAESAATTLASIPKNVAVVQASLAAPAPLGGAGRLEPPPARFPWKATLLWMVLALGVGVLAWMALRLSRELR